MINNLVFLYGRLTDDPELSVTSDNIMYCRFRIAVPRPYSKESENVTDFIGVTASGRTAKFIRDNFCKGKPISVSGAVRIDEWTDRNTGKYRREMYIRANRVDFGIETNLPKKEKPYTVPEPSDSYDDRFDMTY